MAPNRPPLMATALAFLSLFVSSSKLGIRDGLRSQRAPVLSRLGVKSRIPYLQRKLRLSTGPMEGGRDLGLRSTLAAPEVETESAAIASQAEGKFSFYFNTERR